METVMEKNRFYDETKKISEKKELPREVETVRLEPEQIEEIHADEYSLTLFYATRMQPMSLLEIKRQFAEPEAKKAQSIMDRFIKAGLVHITREGKYYSNYPEGYINYAHYRYDSDLEAKKDAKIFQIMKEQTGKRDYWKDKTYFSIDAFFSDEQTTEILDMLKEIKLKAKQYANDNSQKHNIKGLKFRRMKFYDMTLTIFIALLISFGTSFKSFAGGGGNDPTGMMKMAMIHDLGSIKYLAATMNDEGGGGHDPDGPQGGGGHDPDDSTGSGKKFIQVDNRNLCLQNKLIEIINKCNNNEDENCVYFLSEIERLSNEMEY